MKRTRATAAVAPARFAWDATLTATLRHTTLPWGESVAVTPLAAVKDAGSRERVSLLAQFAAHQALLQFAGLADGELDPAEWGVIQKRGADSRLVRLGARAVDVTAAPPVLAVVQQFARVIGADLPILRQPWARADSIYAEAYARLSRDVAADIRWTRGAACGWVEAPGPEGLRLLASENGTYRYRDEATLAAVERFARMRLGLRFIRLEGASPLQRYSALAALGIEDASLDPVAIAGEVLAETAAAPHLFAITREEAFDRASREVVDLLTAAKQSVWLMPHEGIELPGSSPFVVAPFVASGARLRSRRASLEEFVLSPQFDAYLAYGDVPEESDAIPALAEPVRSYIGALALLGRIVPEALAAEFLRDFLYRGDLHDLVIPGATSLTDGAFVFATDAVHEQAARLIPPASRPAICRVAAQHAEGVQAALLWLDAGEPVMAAQVLESTRWTSSADLVRELRRLPYSILTPRLASMYASALVDSGRYRDACELGVGDEVLLARAERRMGDYGTALARLERIAAPTFEAALLRAEMLRLVGRDAEALRVLDTCSPLTDEDRVRLDYERALHGADVALRDDHYLAARFATYRALEREAFADAARHAAESHRRARTAIERIDASLDRLFAVFSAGAWDEARGIAVEALQEVEETQGDRAAGGILFTLAFLAADAGQWAHAAQRIAGLRHYYAATGDTLRLGELALLSAHLDFCRGRFTDARREAQTVFDGRGQHDQIREAAALILDEIDWIERKPSPLRSTGRSGNEELTRRHFRIAACVAGRDAELEDESVPGRLFAFRRALAQSDERRAREIAAELDLVIESAPAAGDDALELLRLAAVRQFPFGERDFERPWCFATRNRLGQWHSIGTLSPSADQLDAGGGSPDWIVCGERELLYFADSAGWTSAVREALAAIFHVRAENYRLRRLIDQEESVSPVQRGAIDGIIGQSAAIREVETVVARVARRDVPVCILGESGTGKELVARAIHLQSPRRHKPFTAVNCAALPENLVESELFGHVRGAFTGADRDRAGLIETTDAGTLFLDEIGELPLPAQAKLLRFLQEGEFRRVGDTANRTADVRIVSATNRKLDSAVEQGRFRDDLYYRIRGVEVLLPPLRDRGGDILLLASHFLNVEREKHGGGPASLAAETEAIFTTYTWPGNVRELQNTIRAAHAMAGEAKQIGVEHLPERIRNVVPAKAAAGSYQDSVSRFKRELIERSLLEARGNQNRAAAMLKMSRQALAYQIRELGIMVRV